MHADNWYASRGQTLLQRTEEESMNREELLEQALYKLQDTISAIHEGVWHYEDKDWLKDLETLMNDISDNLNGDTRMDKSHPDYH